MKIAIITSTFPKNKYDKVPKFIEISILILKKIIQILKFMSYV